MSEPDLLSALRPLALALEWFRRGGESSSQQWKDAQGILKLHRDRLDAVYLRRWAREIGVADLLRRAFLDAGSPTEG